MPYQPSEDLLYFPTIHVKSSNWLKAALLMWDHVYRIVPAGVEPRDSRAVATAVEAGLLRNISIEDADRAAAYEQFSAVLANAPVQPDGFTDDHGHSVHLDKIDQRLRPLLEEASAVLRGDWYDMPRGLARGYMLMLSRTIAERRGLALGTDSPDVWTASAYLDARGNIDELFFDEEAEEQYCHAVIPDVLPVDLASVDMRAIANLRTNHRAEREALRAEITRVLNALARCESATHAFEIQQNAARQLDERKAEFRRSLQTTLGIYATAAIVVGVPTTMEALGALSGGNSPYGLHTVAGSLLIGGVAALAEGRRAREARQGDLVASYLVDVDKLMGTADHLPHFPRLMNEFVND